MEILQEEKPKSKPDSEKILGSDPIAIKKWSHIAISVADMAASIKWYGSVLGFTIKHSGVIPLPGGKQFKAAWLNAPNFCLEIFEFPGAAPMPPDRFNPSTDLKTLGNKYLTLSINNIEKTVTELKKLGVDIITRSEQGIFIRDRDGILIELARAVK
jgi:catechol 2,3-dioxygenase-like lactoylglutathione lyase family enzyme